MLSVNNKTVSGVYARNIIGIQMLDPKLDLTATVVV